jgi:hypothetical protein
MKQTMTSCIIGILISTSLWAGSSSRASLMLQQIFSNPGKPRTSGTASLIRTAYTRAMDGQQFLSDSDRTFEDKSEEKRYLRILQMRTGLDFSLEQDRMTHTFERLYFDGEEKRRDFAFIQSETARSIRENPNLIDDLNFTVYTYNPEKTILRTNIQSPEGAVERYANIVSQKIYFPKFYHFDHGPEVSQVEQFVQLVDKGLATLERLDVDGKVHLVFDIPGGQFRVERILDPGKNMATLYAATFEDGKLQQETICSDYTQLEDGEWYPLKFVSNKYVNLKGEKILASSETYETIAGSVEFNKSIDPSVFSPPLEDETYVIDDRYSPPLEYKIGFPEAEVIYEPLVKNDGSLIIETGSEESRRGKEVSAESKLSGAKVRRIFVPKVDCTKRLSKPFVLDLATGKLILPFASGGEMKERAKTLMQISRGDLAWDGSLLALRKSQVSPGPSQTRNRLKCVEREWCNSYTLPQDSQFPYYLVISTHENEEYLVTIYKIEANGIWLSYDKNSAMRDIEPLVNKNQEQGQNADD